MQIIKTIETLDNFAERSAKDFEMKIRLATFLNSCINAQALSELQITEVREIAEHFELEITLEKLKA